MKDYNFDKIIDRCNTRATKVDALQTFYGDQSLIPLWIADMDFEVCDEIVDALETRMAHHIYGYSCPDDAYWNSIIDWQGRNNDFHFTRQELDYVPGVVKGIGFAVNYFSNRGDKIVIQPPVYHPFKMVIEGNGRQVVNNPLLRNGDSYSMDFDGLENIFKTENPRMMILCNPHNPIGIIWGREVLSKLASLCKKYGVIVVSDEIHGDLALFGNKHIPFATVSDEAADVCVTFGAPSKTFNIPGLVSSWTVVKNPVLREGFFGWLSANEFDEPTFVATIGTEAAYTKAGEWLRQAKNYIEQNIMALEEFCAENLPEIHPIRPQASFLVWLDCSRLGLNHDELINLFVKQAGLALNDGEMFGCEGAHCMRLNVGTNRAKIMQAMSRLRDAIKMIK